MENKRSLAPTFFKGKLGMALEKYLKGTNFN